MDIKLKKYECIICGLIYDEAEGWPSDGIAPGTRWEDVPEDWLCPDCGVGKADFEMIEITADDAGLYAKPALSNAFALGKDAEALLDESALAIERRLDIRVHAFCPV